MNRANLSVRLAPIGGIFLRAVEIDQSRHVQARRAQTVPRDSGLLVVPRVKSLLDSVQSKAPCRCLPVTLLDFERKKARVLSQHNPLLSYTVDLQGKSCIYGKWRGKKFPCAHAARLFLQGEHNIEEYLARYDLSFWYALQYDGVPAYEIPCTRFLFESEAPSGLHLPLAIRPKRGRLRKRMRISSRESSSARVTR